MNVGTSRVKDNEDLRFAAAQRRLHESTGPDDALEAVREIVTGLLGCEEIGLYRVNAGDSRLFWSFGIDPGRYPNLLQFEVPIINKVMAGELQIGKAASERGRSQSLRVFIPIRVNESTVAVLVMLKMLPQKLGLDESDMRVVQLLSQESAPYLFIGKARASSARRNG